MKLVEMNWHPSERQLRQFGVMAFVALPALGWLWGAGGLAMGLLAAVGLVMSGLALLHPKSLQPVFVGFTLISLPIGWVVSEVVLLVLFYGVFLPIGLVLRTIGHDPLDRDLDTRAKSYWQRRKPPSGIESYFRRW